MNPLTLEWIEQAEGDSATAGESVNNNTEPNPKQPAGLHVAE